MIANLHGSDGNAANQIDPRPFLSSHRALSVRLREFDCLTEAAVAGVNALGDDASESAQRPVIRRSPDRCLVQFGPVALTLAWLRNTIDSAAGGELLVVVWRGLIAPNSRSASDRTTSICTPVRSATVEWEEVLRAVAIDAPSWLWQPVDTDIGGYCSLELANRCVARLQLARAHAITGPGSSPSARTSPARS